MLSHSVDSHDRSDVSSIRSSNEPTASLPGSGYGLVLAGGSARGGYQIGVWKALRAYGIQIDAVVGTSIGSMNGVLIAMGDLDRALALWLQVDLTKIIQVKEPLPVPDNLLAWQNLRVLIRTVLQDHGFCTDPLRQLLTDHVDEGFLRSQAIPFGLMTYSLTEHQPLALFLEQIPEGQLIDYLLASCCLPIFKEIRIDGKRMIDGSVYNNLPTEMLLNRGYRRIIEVEIGGKGRVRSFDPTGIELIHLQPSQSLFGAFDMRPEARLERINLGYEDAMCILEQHFATVQPSAGGIDSTFLITGPGPDKS